MREYFGTDGIRGVFNETVTSQLAFNLGRTFCRNKIVIGRDTRVSGEVLSFSVCLGAMLKGCKVVDVGIVPTPAISFFVKEMNFDYGVMITASHNSSEYNGIKIFDKNGCKISVKEEKEFEKVLNKRTSFGFIDFGDYKLKTNKLKDYENHVLLNSQTLEGLKILLDCANGATYKIAPIVFKKLGANVIKTACLNKGERINRNCGALYVEKLRGKMIKKNCDIAIAFDGDGDRVMAIDKSGRIIDGDRILLMLSKYLRLNDLNQIKEVVATQMSNLSLENELKKIGINLSRVDIGDKNITKLLEEKKLKLGAEQSGHIILNDFLPTGDGIMAGVKICEVLKYRNDIFDEVMNLKFYPQILENVVVDFPSEIVNNKSFNELLNNLQNDLVCGGRIFVRASGTEPKLRILVESEDRLLAKGIINTLLCSIKKMRK